MTVHIVMVDKGVVDTQNRVVQNWDEAYFVDKETKKILHQCLFFDSEIERVK